MLQPTGLANDINTYMGCENTSLLYSVVVSYGSQDFIITMGMDGYDDYTMITSSVQWLW